MKITAEFNSVEEVLNFASTFGKTSFKPEQGASLAVKTPILRAVGEVKLKNVVEEDSKITETTQPNTEEPQEDKPEEEPKITKEMVRERLGIVMKLGKQNEVKQLVAKYGASKVPELKKEDYAAIYKEAEGLL